MLKTADDFKNRFNKAISAKNIKPVELAQSTGLSKSTISHYMSGYSKPKSDKLFILAKALDVSEPWLMGLDVPMDRNEYRDFNLEIRDRTFEEIEKFLESSGHYLVCDSYDDAYFTVKNKCGKPIKNFTDYELLNKYKSLKKSGRLNIHSLLSSNSAFIEYIESLGYSIYKDDPEHRPFMSSGGLTVLLEYDTVDALKSKIEKYARATIDAKMLALREKEIQHERIEKEKLIHNLREESLNDSADFVEVKRTTPSTLLNAAHERTDIEVTKEMKKHDDDIMNNDSEWE